MFSKLIKKLAFINSSIYIYILFTSLTIVFSTNTTAFTQVTNNSQIPQKSIPIAVPTPISNPNTISSPNLIWPTRGYISQGFRKYRHEGIDIAGAAGTPIVAAAAGNVVKAGWDEWGLGNAIEIRHPNGSVTVYGHNRRLLVSKGQQVRQGQIIAEMGSTGNSTAPHLHFEYYPNGRLAVNPMSFLGSATANKIPSPPVASNAAKVTPTTQVRQLSPKPENNSPTSNSRSPGAYGGSLLPIPSSIINQHSIIAQPVSPSQPIPMTDAQCNGLTRLQGETANALIRICDENGQLFYIGELKQNPSQPVKIPAWMIGRNRYQADNGTFSYVVSPEEVEVWRNGSQIRTDSFYTFNSQQSTVNTDN
ncbi:MAG TPA: M23 family metallopeptidase [Leptolyngbyaceae cyanobacterium]